ncbi:MAG TPA: HEPN domain-containing protein [Candidatus Nanoarchaeia archaeon]|nr:HEPN domain-containing protein [Candidatus Nanoarchaeia archaeon]
MPSAETFYSSAIAHAYYTIFYSARAYLMKKGLKLPEQGQHQAVYFAFRSLVRQGKIAAELLELYEDVKVKAEKLLEILEKEEENRTKFTYKTFAQANKEPANDSLNNAEIFLTEMKGLIGKN